MILLITFYHFLQMKAERWHVGVPLTPSPQPKIALDPFPAPSKKLNQTD